MIEPARTAVGWALARLRRLRREESGAAAVFVALAMPVVFGILALGIDVSRVYRIEAGLQTAADAAALGAARALGEGPDGSHDLSCQEAAALALDNVTTGAGPVSRFLTVELGTWDADTGSFQSVAACSFAGGGSVEVPAGESPTAVRVLAVRTQAAGNPVELAFAPAIGVAAVERRVEAVARRSGGGPEPSDPLPELPGMYTTDGGRLTINSGGRADLGSQRIYAANDAQTAIRVNAGGWLQAAEILSPGGIARHPGSYVSPPATTPPTEPMTPLADAPSEPEGTCERWWESGSTKAPGCYRNANVSGDVRLESGTYFIRGDLNINSNGTLTAAADVNLILTDGNLNVNSTTFEGEGALDIYVLDGDVHINSGARIVGRPLRVGARNILVNSGAHWVSQEPTGGDDGDPGGDDQDGGGGPVTVRLVR